MFVPTLYRGLVMLYFKNKLFYFRNLNEKFAGPKSSSFWKQAIYFLSVWNKNVSLINYILIYTFYLFSSPEYKMSIYIFYRITYKNLYHV